ncbi:MAG: aspartate ammonia-lyase [Candidatus Aenigmarchaeota archaeon]|nr:aspartate ammonia-lyase [Candidatus Aenigmarchaeota archaeon]
MSFRTEKDYLGEVRVPVGAYYGVQTQRAVANFPISGLRLQQRFVKAQAITKKAAAFANIRTGRLDKRIGDAIVKAADEVIAGELRDQFVVDVYQAGAGTSQNMNMNEVLANRASELLGGAKGEYKLVHPNDHVNMAQSTNDIIHAAIHIAALDALDGLLQSLEQLHGALEEKSNEFSDVLKSARTHLMDAVPMTLGQEFSGYAYAIAQDIRKVQAAADSLLELPAGGTAAGTGMNAETEYVAYVIEEINRITGKSYRTPPTLFAEMQNTYAEVTVSASLRNLAVTLTKIANDLRLLASGPSTGLAEIELPPVQPGSSIMPAKVNPVMAEMLNMAAYQVLGNDVTIANATGASQLELNVMMPVIAYNLVGSTEILAHGISAFTEKCIRGITADEKKCLEYLEKNPIVVTALNPYIGYEKAAEVARKAYRENKTVRDVVLAMNLLPAGDLDRILELRKLTKPGVVKKQ